MYYAPTKRCYGILPYHGGTRDTVDTLNQHPFTPYVRTTARQGAGGRRRGGAKT